MDFDKEMEKKFDDLFWYVLNEQTQQLNNEKEYMELNRTCQEITGTNSKIQEIIENNESVSLTKEEVELLVKYFTSCIDRMLIEQKKMSYERNGIDKIIKESDFSKNYLRSFLFYRKESDIMEEKIREELYSKLESEFDSYKKELETLTSKEIIDKSYETTMKEELMCLFYPESQRYDLDEIKALKNEKNSLETLYQGWMDSDLNINQLLEDNTDEIVAELAEEYKAKQSKKKAKER